MDNTEILDIVKAAKEVFCQGIYVPCDMHPCGWDFLCFEYIESQQEDVDKYKFDIADISDAVYDTHPYEDMTLKEVLTETNGRYVFERSGINWD